MKNISLTSSPLACVVLAAGQGTRMRSDLPKVMHTVAGLPMIAHVINACAALQPDKIVVVIGKNMPTVQEVVAPHSCVIQPDPLGTADAVKAARDALKNFKGDILVLFGDTPLVTAEALKGLREKRAATGAVIVVAGFLPENPSAYGRLVLDNAGHLTAIVEAKEATPEQRAIDLCNSGLMLFEAEKLWPLLERVRSDNAKNEYYLTDCIKLARQEGWDCVVADMSAEDVMGINTRVELAEAERLMQQRLRRQAMLGGVTMIDPSTVYLSADTVLGRDVAIGPNVFIGSGVSISDRAEIRPFCHLEKTHVGVGAIVGPFARLRPGALIGDGVHIGNFVEIKNAEISAGAKINH
ncbi:MAG: NTP transferase domain-containing protein, partial [Alphaproteobacteria bacterium]|nr:NTP transferase domain-containing protein [Alphaproteobacteria bacterium]